MENKNIMPYNTSKINICNFYLLFSNLKESDILLKSYEDFLNEYNEIINQYYMRLTELNSHFLSEEKFKSSVINSPIFQLGKVIKKALETQINKLFSIITDKNFFDAFKNSLSNLSDILQESKIIFDSKFIGKSINPIASSLIQSYSEIESKVIDNYISQKYNKHLIGINNETLEKNIEDIQYLEKTFLDFEENSKTQFFNSLKEMENKTIKVFNEMKNTVEYIIYNLKNQSIKYLNILQKEIIGVQNRTELENKDEKQSEEKLGLNLDNFKYKIKIIYHPNIRVESKNVIIYKDNTKKNLNDNKSKAILYEENEMTLNDEDIYNIVSTLYSYDFKMLNKTDYNLDIEKEKIKVVKLSEKLLPSNKKDNPQELITEAEVNKLYELVNVKENLMKFAIFLNNYRTRGKFKLTERAFDIVKNIFSKAQDYLLKNRDRAFADLIIILSQTFYIIKDGKKYFLQQAINSHELFKKEEFWHNYMEDTINSEINNFEEEIKKESIKYKKSIKEKKIKEIISSKLIPFSSYMSGFEAPKEMILNIINPIIDKYNLDENSRMILMSLLEQK